MHNSYMNYLELIKSRHSVRQYLKKPIEEDIRNALDEYALSLSKQSSLDFQIIYDEPECFSSRMAKYGRFKGVENYISISGINNPDNQEKAGYYGELLVLKAQELGLNTCWVALTHGKSKAIIKEGDKELILISLGYGENQGYEHKNKDLPKLVELNDDDPEWYRNGVTAALLAPTATNQQKFYISRNQNEVSIRIKGIGPYTRMDLGIVKCHFELGAGKENFVYK